jgi:hypothetical protein
MRIATTFALATALLLGSLTMAGEAQAWPYHHHHWWHHHHHCGWHHRHHFCW